MSIYDEFNADIERYLNSKLPELPQSTQMEIGEYISGRVGRLVVEAYEENERRMSKYTKSPRPRMLRRWTNMKDMNDYEIREGDCLEHPGNIVQLIGNYWYVGNKTNIQPLDPIVSKQYAIIGTVHENPELWGGDS